LKIVDLGCGFGWFCRWARRQGAAHVLGLDVSSRMLASATAATADDGVAYKLADLEQVKLPRASFDLAFSSLTFHYIADIARLYGEISRSLVPGGHLVFSTEHPIYTAPRNPRLADRREGRKDLADRQLFPGSPRVTDWLAPGVRKYHRTISASLALLTGSGLAIDQVVEFKPSEEQIATDPTLTEELERPMFLLISAHR
jgi:SAM-dependent methyltransferase